MLYDRFKRALLFHDIIRKFDIVDSLSVMGRSLNFVRWLRFFHLIQGGLEPSTLNGRLFVLIKIKLRYKICIAIGISTIYIHFFDMSSIHLTYPA